MEEQRRLAQPKKIGPFQLNTIQLTGEGEHRSLNIELQHTVSLLAYDVLITIEDIRRNRVLGGVYESVDEFKETLDTDLSDWSAAENGDLTYKFELKRRQFEIVFPAKRQVINPTDQRIKQMGRNFELKLQGL